MSDWVAQYSAALDERDAREQMHRRYIDAYTRLADRRTAGSPTESRSAAIERANTITAGWEKGSSPRPTSAAGTPTKGKTSTSTTTTTTTTTAPTASKDPDLANTNDPVSRLRYDLSSTQKARSALQGQVDELAASLRALEQQGRSSAAQIALLTRQKTEVERRLRDRDEELRGKTKLAESAQDEMVALGLQLNMAEQKSERLGKENKELVERWMKRMGEEAERVNRDSRWE